MFLGQVIVHTATALTVTVNVQVAELLAQSNAVQVTVVVPTLKDEPDAGVQLITAEQVSGQLSVTVGFA
jgi:hypothetical protein